MTAPESVFKNLLQLSFDLSLFTAFMEIFDHRLSEVVDGVEVRGRAAFRGRTREALEILRLSALFGAARFSNIAHFWTTPGRSPRQRACRADSTQVKLRVWV